MNALADHIAKELLTISRRRLQTEYLRLNEVYDANAQPFAEYEKYMLHSDQSTWLSDLEQELIEKVSSRVDRLVEGVAW